MKPLSPSRSCSSTLRLAARRSRFAFVRDLCPKGFKEHSIRPGPSQLLVQQSFAKDYQNFNSRRFTPATSARLWQIAAPLLQFKIKLCFDLQFRSSIQATVKGRRPQINRKIGLLDSSSLPLSYNAHSHSSPSLPVYAPGDPSAHRSHQAPQVLTMRQNT